MHRRRGIGVRFEKNQSALSNGDMAQNTCGTAQPGKRVQICSKQKPSLYFKTFSVRGTQRHRVRKKVGIAMQKMASSFLHELGQESGS